VERQIDTLKVDVMSLEDKVATLSSMQNMTQRAEQLGFVPIEHQEFVNPAAKSYAFAR
jgi:hypothetical protein